MAKEIKGPWVTPRSKANILKRLAKHSGVKVKKLKLAKGKPQDLEGFQFQDAREHQRIAGFGHTVAYTAWRILRNERMWPKDEITGFHLFHSIASKADVELKTIMRMKGWE